jgi:hypothetical protein
MCTTQEAVNHATTVRRSSYALALILMVWLVSLLGAGDAAAHPTITFRCTPAPEDCSGWYRTDVTLHWIVTDFSEDHPVLEDDCGPQTFSRDTPATGTTVSCTARDSDSVQPSPPVTIRVDKTPPVVTGGRPGRGADSNGWYTRPVAIDFAGTDATSGLAGCTSLTYRGPDSATASVHGTCTDNAGNLSAPFAYGLKYDETPPTLAAVSATTGDRRVVVRWAATGGADAVEVVRSPGLAGAHASVVVRGRGVSFTDTQVRNGRRYEYEVRSVDAAGNVSSRTVTAKPGRRLIAPAPGAILDVTTPPLLRWTPIRGARYYNVQLFRDGRKILSAWPTRARLQLKRAWRYGATRVRFEAGTYRWQVWPGRVARSKADYGPRIGIRKFVVP